MKNKQNEAELIKIISDKRNVTEEMVEERLKDIFGHKIEDIMEFTEHSKFKETLQKFQAANKALHDEIINGKGNVNVRVQEFRKQAEELKKQKIQIGSQISRAITDGTDAADLFLELHKVNEKLTQAEDLAQLFEKESQYPGTEKVRELAKKVFYAGVELIKAKVECDRAGIVRNEKISALYDLINAYGHRQGGCYRQYSTAQKEIVSSCKHFMTEADTLTPDEFENVVNTEIEKLLHK